MGGEGRRGGRKGGRERRREEEREGELTGDQVLFEEMIQDCFCARKGLLVQI